MTAGPYFYLISAPSYRDARDAAIRCGIPTRWVWIPAEPCTRHALLRRRHGYAPEHLIGSFTPTARAMLTAPHRSEDS